MDYEYGPYCDLEIKLTGTFKDMNGNYSDLSIDQKDLLQVLCHAVAQIYDKVNTLLNIGTDLYIIKVVNKYLINSRSTGMSVMDVTRIDNYHYEVDHISPSLQPKLVELIDFATEDVELRGRKY